MWKVYKDNIDIKMKGIALKTSHDDDSEEDDEYIGLLW